ncbi:hypothetical protein SDRG_03663, partial [Saprolegnia diclina VS20]
MLKSSDSWFLYVTVHTPDIGKHDAKCLETARKEREEDMVQGGKLLNEDESDVNSVTSELEKSKACADEKAVKRDVWAYVEDVYNVEKPQEKDEDMMMTSQIRGLVAQLGETFEMLTNRLAEEDESRPPPRCNLLRFNRLVGSVWVGRQLMLIRGMSAILLLSAPQLQLTSSCGYTRMVARPRSYVEAAVIAGEATWFTYSLHDLLVLVFADMTRIYAPLSAAFIWISHLALDVAAPVGISIEIDRRCVGQDMDSGLLCTAGRIVIGSSDRVLLLLWLQIASLVVALVIASAWRVGRGYHACKANDGCVLLLGTAQAFIVPYHAAPLEPPQYDAASCVLCGLLAIPRTRYAFNIVLWSTTAIELPAAYTTTAVIPDSRARETVDHFFEKLESIAVETGTRKRRLLRALGLLYMIISILGSVSYFEISKVNLANDLYWPNFNVTGHHAFFANWLNEQLVLGLNNHNIALDDPSINLLGSYAAPTAFVSTVNNYGAWLQHNELSAIEASIAGLRVSDACNAPWIFTPYCYLDWKKRWQMAYSNQRQLRCQKMEKNAAVYLESVLRNIDYATFAYCWGSAFETAFGADLRQSSDGQDWLHSMATERLPLQDETALWRQHNLSIFQVQWQNYKRIGAINSYTITNAYGIAYPMTLMALNGSYRWSSQTTYKMYWSLANDLSAIASNTSGISGLSLLRTSPRFAFANTSLQAVLTTNLTLMSPLAKGLALVAATIGPFGVTDMVYVRVPAAVSSVFRDIIQMTRLAMAPSVHAQAAYNQITPLGTSYPIPKKWLTPNYGSLGGSPLCQELIASKVVSGGLTCMPSYDLPCLPTSPVQSK